MLYTTGLTTHFDQVFALEQRPAAATISARTGSCHFATVPSCSPQANSTAWQFCRRADLPQSCGTALEYTSTLPPYVCNLFLWICVPLHLPSSMAGRDRLADLGCHLTSPIFPVSLFWDLSPQLPGPTQVAFIVNLGQQQLLHFQTGEGCSLVQNSCRDRHLP